MSLIIVDMDGVIADWGTGYGEALDTWGDAASGIPRHKDQRSFDLTEGLTPLEKRIVADTMMSMRYITLPVIPGAIKALRSMVKHGHDVVICTSPWLPNKRCAQDKIDWIEGKLGKGWSERMIITKDKTMVVGDYLVDDKPKISGRFKPGWKHVMFSQPYNKDIDNGLRLDSWANWKNEDY